MTRERLWRSPRVTAAMALMGCLLMIGGHLLNWWPLVVIGFVLFLRLIFYLVLIFVGA